MKKLFIL